VQFGSVGDGGLVSLNRALVAAGGAGVTDASRDRRSCPQTGAGSRCVGPRDAGRLRLLRALNAFDLLAMFLNCPCTVRTRWPSCRNSVAVRPRQSSACPFASAFLNCTGDHAGEKYCLICENGDNPVAIIFAREVTPEVTKLLKRIDLATDMHRVAGVVNKDGRFVLFR